MLVIIRWLSPERGSNPRPQSYQDCVLPLNYLGTVPSQTWPPRLTRCCGQDLSSRVPRFARKTNLKGSLQSHSTNFVTFGHKVCAGSRIRTCGALAGDGFTDRCNCPLCHPSVYELSPDLRFFLNCGAVRRIRTDNLLFTKQLLYH